MAASSKRHEDCQEDGNVEDETVRLELRSGVMLKLLEPYLELYERELYMAPATIEKRMHCARKFLRHGDRYVSPQEIEMGEISPVSLKKHLEDATELETGYLHPQSKTSMNVITKKLHIDYVGCFIKSLELMEDYFPGRAEIRLKAFNTMRKKLNIAKRWFLTPIKQHKVKLHALNKEARIPSLYIQRLLESDVLDRLMMQMKVEILHSKSLWLQIRDFLFTYIACHSVRRAKELITFSNLRGKLLQIHRGLNFFDSGHGHLRIQNVRPQVGSL